MSKNFRNRKRKHNKKLPARYTLLIMTAVCFVTMLLSLTLNISGGPLKTAAGYVFIPMQKGINSFGIHISDKITEIRTLKNVKAENKKLKAEVEELTTQLTTTKLEQYELDNYRQLLDLDAKYPSYPKVAASVIAKDSGNWFSTFTIDKGKKDGVDVGMNVLAGSGLVGIVTDAGDNFAKVRCIIDDASKVSGMVSTTEDILTEVNKTPAEVVFVLPNNKNIIMAAQQCIPLSDKKVIVIPTKTVPQGITAMLSFDPASAEDVIEAELSAAIESVHTAQITYAARDSDFDGHDIHKGEYLALMDGALLGSDADLDKILTRIADAANDLDPEIVSIYYGEDVQGDAAQHAADLLGERLPMADVNVVNGGQPVYYYMISFE